MAVSHYIIVMDPARTWRSWRRRRRLWWCCHGYSPQSTASRIRLIAYPSPWLLQQIAR